MMTRVSRQAKSEALFLAARHDHRAGNDDYTQAGNLFRFFDPGQRARLLGNGAGGSFLIAERL